MFKGFFSDMAGLVAGIFRDALHGDWIAIIVAAVLGLVGLWLAITIILCVFALFGHRSSQSVLAMSFAGGSSSRSSGPSFIIPLDGSGPQVAIYHDHDSGLTIGMDGRVGLQIGDSPFTIPLSGGSKKDD